MDAKKDVPQSSDFLGLAMAALLSAQQVIATLGRFEDLHADGQLERLLRSCAVCGQGHGAGGGGR